MIDWAHVGTAVTAAFLASLVEFVEALTIVLAVGTVRGWRPALLGTGAGVLLLTLLVALFGPALQRVPITVLQVVVGVLLVLFGMRWLRKAVLRAAGVIALHDEDAIYAREQRELAAEPGATGSTSAAIVDVVAVLTTFKAVVLEGLEVVFIVIATGAVGGMLVPAAIGAAGAGLLVVAAGLVLHRPLARVPENALKFAVGVLLSAFGTFWVGEGLRLEWPGGEFAVLGLIAGFALVAGLGVALARGASADPAAPGGAR